MTAADEGYRRQAITWSVDGPTMYLGLANGDQVELPAQRVNITVPTDPQDVDELDGQGFTLDTGVGFTIEGFTAGDWIIADDLPAAEDAAIATARARWRDEPTRYCAACGLMLLAGEGGSDGLCVECGNPDLVIERPWATDLSTAAQVDNDGAPLVALPRVAEALTLAGMAEAFDVVAGGFLVFVGAAVRALSDAIAPAMRDLMRALDAPQRRARQRRQWQVAARRRR